MNVVEITEPVSEEERAQIAHEFAELRRTNLWLVEHYDELPATYPDLWIAYTAEGVIDSDASLEAIVDRLAPEDRLSPRVQLEFIPSKPLHLSPSTIHLQ